MRNMVLHNPGTRVRVWNDFDRLFDGVFDGNTRVSGRHLPSVDIRETEDNYLLEAELPGLTNKDIDVKVEDNLLSISTVKEEKKEEQKNGYLLRERRSGSFRRSFVLPKDADAGKIEAGFKDGILTLDIPKAEESKPRSIEVNVK